MKVAAFFFFVNNGTAIGVECSEAVSGYVLSTMRH